MRDNSPRREPSMDANRKPQVTVFDDDVCASCRTSKNLGVVGDWILCAGCELEHERGE